MTEDAQSTGVRSGASALGTRSQTSSKARTLLGKGGRGDGKPSYLQRQENWAAVIGDGKGFKKKDHLEQSQ